MLAVVPRLPRFPATGVLVAVVFAMAGLSLLWASAPQFDPQGWLLWGREITDSKLPFSTFGYPSWKPLPALVTVPLSLLGDSAPALWLVLMRVAMMLGLVVGFRLGRRLGGVAAGLVAVAALILLPRWLGDGAQGFSEPLLVALVLLAIERHLAQRPWAALVAALLAGLDRPEAWPLAAVLAFLLWRERGLGRPLASGLGFVVLLGLLPLAWFGGDWLGSHDAFHAGRLARHAGNAIATRRGDPVIHSLDVIRESIMVPVAAGAIASLALAFRERDTVVVWAACVGWIAITIASVTAGFPADGRFVAPAAALACVLAGAGFARLVGLASRGKRSIALAVVLLALASPWTVAGTESLVSQARATRRLGRAVASFDAATRALGGRTGVLACGEPGVVPALQTRLTWNMRAPTWAVRFRHPPGLLFDDQPGDVKALLRHLHWRTNLPVRVAARFPRWRVYQFVSSARRPQPRWAGAPPGARCRFAGKT
ncbi:MAG: hypothetical protein QOK31_858 [Solirubrobacteraceae bacterium]|jgi:hypothetical protein|nr:hypothetical protein [Solirubrobacteraceae bacterium]